MSNDGPVVILSAIRPELASLHEALIGAKQTRIAGRFAASGRLDGHQVVLAEAGIGKVNTAVTATLLVERFRCRLIVFTGVAGGLDPSLRIGDVVIADRTIQHDAGVVEDEGLRCYQAGHVPFFNPTRRLGYPAPADLLSRARSRMKGFELPPLSIGAGGEGESPRVAFGTLLTGDQFVNSEQERERLHGEFEALAVEMEGAALGQVSEVLGIEHLVIRSLSDLAGAGSTVDFSQFLDEVAANSVRVVRHLLAAL